MTRSVRYEFLDALASHFKRSDCFINLEESTLVVFRSNYGNFLAITVGLDGVLYAEMHQDGFRPHRCFGRGPYLDQWVLYRVELSGPNAVANMVRAITDWLACKHLPNDLLPPGVAHASNC
jgi:hypothetical protein